MATERRRKQTRLINLMIWNIMHGGCGKMAMMIALSGDSFHVQGRKGERDKAITMMSQNSMFPLSAVGLSYIERQGGGGSGSRAIIVVFILYFVVSKTFPPSSPSPSPSLLGHFHDPLALLPSKSTTFTHHHHHHGLGLLLLPKPSRLLPGGGTGEGRRSKSLMRRMNK